MNTDLSVQAMQPGQETQVYELVARVFNEFVAPDFPPEGVQEFLKFIRPEALRERSAWADHFTLVATLGDDLVGVIELRNNDHVSLYFVDAAHMHQGIGRELWLRALARCRCARPDLHEITVNSSPYAVPIYEKLGFRRSGAERVVNGIRFVPMVLKV